MHMVGKGRERGVRVWRGCVCVCGGGGDDRSRQEKGAFREDKFSLLLLLFRVSNM